MTINEAIANADALRPNTISNEQKAAWVMDLDGQLAEMMAVPAPERNWPEEDAELLIPAPYEEIYQLYLIGKIDFYNQDMNLYANDTEAYEAALREARAWWRRNHRPVSYGGWRV